MANKDILKNSILEAKKVKSAVEQDSLLKAKQELAEELKKKLQKPLKENAGLQGPIPASNTPQGEELAPAGDPAVDPAPEQSGPDRNTPVTELTVADLIEVFEEVFGSVNGQDDDIVDLDPGDGQAPQEEEELINLSEDKNPPTKRPSLRSRRGRLRESREGRLQSTARRLRSDREALRNDLQEVRRTNPPTTRRTKLSESTPTSRRTLGRRRKSLSEGREFYGLSSPQVLGKAKQGSYRSDLLNAKLQYTNRICKDFTLTESQQSQIINAFNKADSIKVLEEVYRDVITSLSNPIKTPDASAASRPLGTDLRKPENLEQPVALQEVREMQRRAGILTK